MPFKRKRQRGNNYCPSEGEPNANEIEQIEADQPRKGGGDTNSAEKERQVKDEQLGESLKIFDPEGSLFYLCCYLDISTVTFIKKGQHCQARGDIFYVSFSSRLNFDHGVSLRPGLLYVC